MIKIGDIVTRKSYKNDTLFIVMDYKDDVYFLKGKNVRLYADAFEEDLQKSISEDKEDQEFIERIQNLKSLDRNNYFYLPGKVLHIDGDNDYLTKCLSFYKKNKIQAVGKLEKEENVFERIEDWMLEFNPNIIVITGHDALLKKSKTEEKYKNSENFIKTIKKCREVNRNQDQLILIAGACQSNYEELICAGANFASSPKRINIHALDPAIIAAQMAFSDVNKDINIKSILEKTKYGCEGMGGIITKGTMHIGFPR